LVSYASQQNLFQSAFQDEEGCGKLLPVMAADEEFRGPRELK